MTKKITRKNLEKFLGKYATDALILDVGSGGSSYDKFFPNRLTVDIDPARGPEIVADAHNLPFKDGEFDLVLCTEMLEHVEDPFKVERELWRITSPGGRLILTTRFVYPLHDSPHDYWRFTEFGLRKLFSKWEIMELQPETRTFSALAALMQRIIFQTQLKANKLSKLMLLGVLKIFLHLDWIISKEYGDIKRSNEQAPIISTGYMMICNKDR